MNPEKPKVSAEDIEHLIEIFKQSGWDEMHLEAAGLEVFLSNDPSATGPRGRSGVAERADVAAAPPMTASAAPSAAVIPQATIPEGLVVIRAHTKDVVELLDYLGVAQAHLMGSSAGAFVSQSVAANYPERILTLACFAATPGMKKGKTDYQGWVTRIGATGVAAFLRETIGDRIRLDQVEPGFVDWFIAESARTPVGVLARVVPMMAGIDLAPELPKIKCPTLVVVPGADPIHVVDEYRVLERQIPDCEFIVYEGMPHNITDAVPDRCARELKRFLLAHAQA